MSHTENDKSVKFIKFDDQITKEATKQGSISPKNSSLDDVEVYYWGGMKRVAKKNKLANSMALKPSLPSKIMQ